MKYFFYPTQRILATMCAKYTSIGLFDVRIRFFSLFMGSGRYFVAICEIIGANSMINRHYFLQHGQISCFTGHFLPTLRSIGGKSPIRSNSFVNCRKIPVRGDPMWFCISGWSVCMYVFEYVPKGCKRD